MSQPDKSNLDWALEYAAKDWPVFPIFYVKADGTCSCGEIPDENGKNGCGRIGKHPKPKTGLKEATTIVGTIEAWWKTSIDIRII